MLIPVVGDVIKLKKDTSFDLKNVRQNNNFLKKIEDSMGNVNQINKNKHHISIKKGTLLTIDRVYIRQGDSSDFNSITFKISNDENLPNGRFFITVEEANTLDIEFLGQKSEVKPIKLNQYLWQITDKRKKSTEWEACRQLEKIECYNFNVNSNLVKTVDILIKEVDKWCLEKFDMNFDAIFDNAVNYLKEKSISIDKNIASESKENLKIMKEIDFKGHDLRKDVIDLNNINLFNIKMLKLENKNIKTTHLLEISKNKDNDYIFENIENYIKNIEFIIYQHTEANKLSIYSYILTHNQKIKLINNLTQSSKDYYGILRNHNLMGYEGYEIFDKNSTSFTPYEHIKHITLLNPKYYDFVEINDIIKFSDEEKSLTLKEIRSKLTKNKKNG